MSAHRLLYFEWDGRLRAYFHAYDALVDDGSWSPL